MADMIFKKNEIANINSQGFDSCSQSFAGVSHHSDYDLEYLDELELNRAFSVFKQI
jgi:hypothetical protein